MLFGFDLMFGFVFIFAFVIIVFAFVLIFIKSVFRTVKNSGRSINIRLITGEKQPEQPAEPQELRCPYCGAPIHKTDSRCEYCSSKL